MTENGNGHNGRNTAAQFIEAIKGSGGIITSIAKRIGCEWHTAKRYIEKYPTIAQAYSDEREGISDLAEVALITAIRESEAWAIKFYLKCQAKDRGYVERTEVETNLKGEIKVITEYVDNWRSASPTTEPS